MPKITFVNRDGSETVVDAVVGESVLDVAWKNNIDIEGACEGQLACSTCHVIVDDAHFDSLEEPSEDEEDLLDLAWGLTGTSRLGCQIKVTEALDGMVLRLPQQARNMMG